MSQEVVHNRKPTSAISLYLAAWRTIFKYWKVIILSYFVNLFIVFLGVGPLSIVIKNVIENTNLHDDVAGPFSYTLFMDLLNNHGAAIGVAGNAILSLAVPFLLWSVFCSGGFMRLTLQKPENNIITEFWRGGVAYFLRYLRLAFYVLIAIAVSGSLSFFILAIKGLNPLALLSEGIVIRQFWLAIVLLAIALFLISIFKESAKAKIANSTDKHIFNANFAAAKNLASTKTLILGIINVSVLIFILVIYLLLKKAMGSSLIPAVILGQLFLIFRIAARYVKQTSYSYLEGQNKVSV